MTFTVISVNLLTLSWVVVALNFATLISSVVIASCGNFSDVWAVPFLPNVLFVGGTIKCLVG